MPVLVSCPNCQHKLSLPESAIGKRGRCPACQETFVAAAPSSEPVVIGTDPPAEEVGVAEVAEGVAAAPAEQPLRAKKPYPVRPASQSFLRLVVLLTGLAGAIGCGLIYWLWEREQA